MERHLDTILNTSSKVKIIRLFASRREDFIASGREIARLIRITPPAAHAALKELYNQDILKREIIGKQHIYKLNIDNRTVKDMLVPVFEKEQSIKKDIFNFLRKKIKEKKIEKNIVSLLLYGSMQKGSTDEKGDIDIAAILKGKIDKKRIEKIFIGDIANQFYDYFGIHLDVYIKTKNEFINRLKKNLPPVSTLMKAYSIVYGKDPINF